MNKVIFCKYQPILSLSLPPSILLVFECIPEQYSLVCEWMATKWDKVTPLYRILVLEEGEDLCDYEESKAKNPWLEFTGRFECWPERYPFRVKQITWDETTGGPSQSRYGDFLRCAKLEPYLLPRLATGISQVQEYALQQIRGPYPLQALVELVAYECRISPELARGQILLMQWGNFPLLEIVGDQVRLLQHRGLLQGETPIIPLALVNGPYPLNPLAVRDAICNMYHYKEWREALDSEVPFCRPHAFRGGASVALGFRGKIIPPYRSSISDPSLLVSPHGLFGDLKAEYSNQLEKRWVFWGPEGVVEFSKPSDYLERWCGLFIGSFLGEKLDWPKVKNNFLCSLVLGDTFEVKTKEGGRIVKKKYFEESLEEKRERLVKDGYPPQFCDRLLALSVSEINPSVLYKEETDVFRNKSIREEWMELLSKLTI